MRNRDADRVALELYDFAGKIVELVPRVRKRLRDWSSAGYPSGAGESSIGSDRHSDPVMRAVAAGEITNARGDHLGWRPTDDFGDRLIKLDKDLAELHERARDLYGELSALDHLYEGEADPGCALCGAVRQAVNATTGKAEHECSPACIDNDHRHPNGWQRIHNRKAPRPPDEELDPVADVARCSFHFLFAERYGEDAATEIAAYHLDHLGERIPYGLIRDHHADAFARHHNARRTA